MANPTAMSPAQMQQQNFLMRQAVTSNAIKMKQQIYSSTFDPTSSNVINISNSIRNVGLLLGFVVEVSGGVTNGATDTATRTPFGNANIVTQFRYDDLNNYTRIQVPGWYLATLNTVRQGFGYGGVYANNIPMGYGDNFGVYSGAATIAGAGTSNLRQVYYVPISYSSTDLRGAIWMSTVSATSNLQITINADPFTGTGDPINYVYTGNNNGAWTDTVTVTVYQVYLDQVPRMENGQPILPPLDLNTVYDLKQTAYTGVTADQDFPMPYSNFRQFLSTTAVYDNAGVYNGGSDVNYFALQTANFSNPFKVSAKTAALDGRMSIMTDFPVGTYFFESRDIPINTINYGNQELVLNASSAGSGARVLVGYESFAQVNQLAGATSLGGG